MKKRKATIPVKGKPQKTTPDVAVRLFGEIRDLVDAARQHVAVAVNSTTTMLYWQIGSRIRKNILGEERAEYGKQMVSMLSRQLVHEYGRGFSERNLAYMIRFAEVFPRKRILHTLCAKLSWSHIRQIIYIDDDLKRQFYAELCRLPETTKTR